MFAAVDLGSNSFRMHIATIENQTLKIITSAREPIRLGAGLNQHGELSQEAIDKAINCLKNFRDILKNYPHCEVKVVATNTIRVANNAQDCLPLFEKAIGCPIDVISGEEEGRLIYLGVSRTLDAHSKLAHEKRLVIDIGGGSTEIIVGHAHEIQAVESFGIGTVKQSSDFFPQGCIKRSGFEKAVIDVRSQLEDYAPEYLKLDWKSVYGSSGTIRAISEALDKNGFGDGTITLKKLEQLRDYCIEKSHINHLNLDGVKTERIPMVISGIAILLGIFQELHIQKCEPIEAGLRVGVIWDGYLRSIFKDRREDSILHLMGKFAVDLIRAKHITELSQSIYQQLCLHQEKRPSHESDADIESMGKFLSWSAQLHEVGKFISHTKFHKHSSYLVENADIVGFSSSEQSEMALLLLAQKGNLKKIFSTAQTRSFTYAVIALRLANILLHNRSQDTHTLSVNEKLEFQIQFSHAIILQLPQAWRDENPTIFYGLQKETQQWREIGIEYIIQIR